MPKPTLVDVLTHISKRDTPVKGYVQTEVQLNLSVEQAEFMTTSAQKLGLASPEHFPGWLLDQMATHLELGTPPDLIVEAIRRQLA